MGSLEVVSKETFQQQLDGISSCAGCQKERLKEAASRKMTRRTRKGAQVKSNSPIVVRLRDTIKVNIRSKLKDCIISSDVDSDLSSDESTVASAASSRHGSTSSTPPESPRERHPRKARGSRLNRIRRSRKDGKNFNAFLSAIEKVHSKECGLHLINNLNQYNWHSKDYKNLAQAGFRTHGSELLLNNAVAAAYQNSITASILRGVSGNSSVSHHHICSKPKTLQSINKDNVELICNDLNSESQGSGVGGVEVESVLDSVSAGSSSDSQSESEGCTETPDTELTPEELDSLREFTTGCPLTRYSCPPHECPECLAAYYAYTHYFAQGSDILKIEVFDKLTDEDEQSDPPAASVHVQDQVNQINSDNTSRSQDSSPTNETLSSDEQESRAHLEKNIKPHKPKRVEVSVAAFFDKPKKPSKSQLGNHKHFDTVSIDLTDSDVTYSVSYPGAHSEGGGMDSEADSQATFAQVASPPWPNNYYDFYHNFYTTMLGFMPFLIPAYWAPPFNPWGYNPSFTVPRPFNLHKDLPKSFSSHRGTQTPEYMDFKPFTATQPPQRPWIPLAHPDTTKSVAIFTVMCYNILCDKYATRQLYGYCPSWALNWEYRKKIIIDEIRQYSADIISLQEVETEQFYSYFLPELKANGYDGVFAPKSRARTMSEADRKHVDGCAIFFQMSKFTLVKDYLIEFNQMAISTADGSHDMINRVMTKDNIGLAALLETKDNAWENGVPPDNQAHQHVLVATCHVHWDPEFCDVKLVQTMMLMAELKNIIQDTQTSLRPGSSLPDCNSLPLILCGDLNSLPESGVVDFLNIGKVSAKHEDFKGLGYEDCLRKLSISENKDVYTHGFKLTQAYSNDVMPYTNYTYDFKGIIDYIFYSRDFLRPLGLLGPLDQEWFQENKVFGCPHPQIPSDHLPLLTEFEMVVPSSITSTNDNRRSNSAASHSTARR